MRWCEWSVGWDFTRTGKRYKEVDTGIIVHTKRDVEQERNMEIFTKRKKQERKRETPDF